LARSEVTGDDGELNGEVDVIVWDDTACSGDVAGGSYQRRDRIALDAAPTWCASCHEVETTASIVVWMVSSHDRYGGSGEPNNARNTQETQRFILVQAY
jgi:hypothetical protein